MGYVREDAELPAKMSRLGVRKEDVEERFIRAQGPGGQNVNKVSTCVYLKHVPTGIEVKCQRQRYQAQNRILAWQILLRKIEARRAAELSEERKRAEKIRRQKRKRSRRAKLKILEAKRFHSVKKSLRAKVRDADIN